MYIKENKELADKLPDLVDEGLQKLYLQQNPDGGWGWWPNKESNVHISSYVVFALTKAYQADIEVSDTVFANGQRFLVSSLGNININTDVEKGSDDAMFVNAVTRAVPHDEGGSDSFPPAGGPPPGAPAFEEAFNVQSIIEAPQKKAWFHNHRVLNDFEHEGMRCRETAFRNVARNMQGQFRAHLCEQDDDSWRFVADANPQLPGIQEQADAIPAPAQEPATEK